MLTDGLLDGCGNWDIVIVKALSICLIPSPASRSGDVLKAQSADKDRAPPIRYSELRMRPVGGDKSLDCLVVRMTIAAEKRKEVGDCLVFSHNRHRHRSHSYCHCNFGTSLILVLLVMILLLRHHSSITVHAHTGNGHSIPVCGMLTWLS